MGKKVNIKNKLMEFKKNLSKRLDIKEMILFGSYARGDYNRHSDIDLIIVSPNFENVKSFKRSIGLYKYMSLDLPVDYICYTPKEFQNQKKRVSLVRSALKEGVMI